MKDINAPFRQHRSKSLGTQLREDVTFVIIGCFVIYVIMEIFRIIFSPFRYLLMSTKQIEEEEHQKALQKAKDRDSYLSQFEDDPNDPMYQYRQRFIKNPGEYENDPDNKVYLQWYETWKAGRIKDTKLRWAPEVYIKKPQSFCGWEKQMNGAFLNYFEIQFNMHREKWAWRTAFLATIRKYYPEFTPTVEGIEQDLACLQNRAKERQLYDDLIEEIMKFNIPKKDAEKLAKLNLTADETRRQAAIIKKCIEKGNNSGFYIASHGIDPDSEGAALVDKMMRALLPEFVINAYFDGKIDNDDVLELKENADSILKLWGHTKAFHTNEDGTTMYRSMLLEDMSEMIAKHREEEEKPVWEQKNS